jgi:AraC family transcriptional regulator, transcriptional activator of pobA
MSKPVSLAEFYQQKIHWLPDNLQQDLGHFNVFRLEDFVGPDACHLPYSRKDFYKITLVTGRSNYHFADKTVEIRGHALLFANPLVPYEWEPLDDQQTGFFCIFTAAFLQRHLSAGVLELVHGAQKLQPATTLYHDSTAATRIASLFAELLERQFPIETPGQRVRLRTAHAFAGQLAVHVNHLNRALKEVTGKTTTQLIAERLVREAHALLRHTRWNVGEISYCLGFEEPAHFSNFFRKHTGAVPSAQRAV